jgi:hypothetical protein
VLATVLLAGGCGSDEENEGTVGGTVVPTATETTPQTATATATTDSEAPEQEPGGPVPGGSLRTFRTPTGNIGCVMSDQEVRCDIRQQDWSPPRRPASCQLDYGQGISVGIEGRARFVCAGDTALDSAALRLPYGRTSRAGNFSCASRVSGITCRNTVTGHGFFMARDRYRVF